MARPVIAAAFVALAALLWGVDSIVTLPGLGGIPGPALTFYEHVLGLVILVPFVVRPSRRELRLLRPRHLLPLFWVGIAGEAVAGFLFGEAYGRVGAGASGFLQMLQPFCVLAIAWALRRERTASSYVPWAMSVLFGALVIWVFDPGFDTQVFDSPGFWTGAGAGFLAVVLWAAGNMASKILLETFSPSSLVFLRWTLSLAGFAVILAARSIPLDLRPFLGAAPFAALLAHAVVFALVPLWLFYRGLRELPASLATFVELACPLALVFLPAILGGRAMHQAQWLGGISVVVGVMLLLRLELEFVRRRDR